MVMVQTTNGIYDMSCECVCRWLCFPVVFLCSRVSCLPPVYKQVTYEGGLAWQRCAGCVCVVALVCSFHYPAAPGFAWPVKCPQTVWSGAKLSPHTTLVSSHWVPFPVC
jgi:hypothetical protein